MWRGRLWLNLYQGLPQSTGLGAGHDAPTDQNKFLRLLASEAAAALINKAYFTIMTTVRPVLTVFFTVLITIAAARASSPEVGSSINIIDGLATSSRAIVSLLRCSMERPFTPGNPTIASLNEEEITSLVVESTSEGSRSHTEKSKDSYTVT